MLPFVTERVWQDLVVPVDPAAAQSVHMATWPVANRQLIDDQLADEVALTRRLVELGRAARAESKVRTRQPLARALVGAWAGERTMQAFQGLWPRWRQLTSTVTVWTSSERP
jgi:isoleucyl-tRNA synthetase